MCSRGGQHHEERMLGAPVIQEVQRPVRLHRGDTDETKKKSTTGSAFDKFSKNKSFFFLLL